VGQLLLRQVQVRVPALLLLAQVPVQVLLAGQTLSRGLARGPARVPVLQQEQPRGLAAAARQVGGARRRLLVRLQRAWGGVTPSAHGLLSLAAVPQLYGVAPRASHYQPPPLALVVGRMAVAGPLRRQGLGERPAAG